MYNQISHLSDSTMDSYPIQLHEMTWDEVKIALEESMSKLRTFEEEARVKSAMIMAKTQKQIAEIQAKAQMEVSLAKSTAKSQIFEAEQRMRQKTSLEIVKKEKLEKLDGKFKTHEIELDIQRRLIQSKVRKSSFIESDQSELLSAIRKLERHGIHIEAPSSKATNQATDRKYNPSQYSFRSVQSRNQQTHSQISKRR